MNGELIGYMGISLIVGAVLAILVTRKLAVWIDAVKTLNGAAMLKKENSQLRHEIHQHQQSINQLKRRNELLEKQVELLKKENSESLKTLELQQEKMDERDKLYTESQLEIKKLHGERARFEKSLFKALTKIPGVDPSTLEVVWGNWEE